MHNTIETIPATPAYFTVIVIEHNLDVIRQADWVIDMGPEGGKCGGQVLYEGVPSGLLHCEASQTGRCLRAE